MEFEIPDEPSVLPQEDGSVPDGEQGNPSWDDYAVYIPEQEDG